MSTTRRDEELSWGPREAHTVLHHDTPRRSGPDKVRGAALYSHDRRLPGLCYGVLVHARAGVGPVEVDLAPALALPGVLTGLQLREEVSFLGQAVAAVAAETPEQAADAARAVVVALDESGGWSLTPEAALAAGAAQVTRRGNVSGPDEDGDAEAVAKALERADFVVEAEYRVPVQHHMCLEPHGVVCDYRGGDTATVYASTQVAFGIPGSAAEALGLDASKVRCIVHHMGGGFGSKFSMDTPGRAACLLAKALGRPVHVFNDRAQEFLSAGNRSGSIQRVRAGATKDGKLSAYAVEIDRLGGVGRGAGNPAPYAYRAGATHVATRSIRTHTDSSRAMRAPGHPQGSYVTESVVDELCYGLGLDLLEFRKQNLPEGTWHRQLERVAREIGWYEHPHRTAPGRGDGWTAEGIGFGVSMWGGGGHDGAECAVRIAKDGSVTSSMGVQDLGTGVRTLVAMIAAEELGLRAQDVEPRIGDTDLPPGVGSGGSVTTGSISPAVKVAAHEARLAFAAHVAPVLGCPAERVTFAGGKVFDAQTPDRGLTWRDACATLPGEGLSGYGKWRADLQGSGVHGAQAARVRVDLMTGHVQVLKMVCCQDSGLVLNPLTWRSQVNGAMIQGLGQALLEERVLDQDLGIALNAQLQDYKIPGCLEIPELVALIDEGDTREVPIGVGEPPVIPGPGAIANAVHNACGVRVRSLPITPDKLLDGLAALRAGGATR
ncbi:MAG: xanthine dehydrogenase family protein [Planctomycetes bacterium]|nr:xanthine dehydrogenase family protein [Planctomycetota bacterium]